MSTAYYPQIDNQTKRLNCTLEEILRTMVNYQQDDWDKHLIAAEFTYNNSIQSSTQISPFDLTEEHPLFVPFNLLNFTPPLNVPTVDEFCEQYCTTIQIVR